MRLFTYKNRHNVTCPTKETCIGESCACFNREYDWYKYKSVHFEYEKPWWSYFRPFYFREKVLTDFYAWTPPEVEGWEFFGHEAYSFLEFLPRARYRRLNEDRRFSCGLNCER